MKLALLILFFSLQVSGAPAELEVWFLSKDKVAQLQQLLKENTKTGPLTASRACQQMGEFCFDPQLGLYRPGDEDLKSVDVSLVPDAPPELPTAKSVERDLINCDTKNYFDVFCGKSRASGTPRPKLDLWIDTSGSMREFDSTDKSGGCFRKSLVSRLDKFCSFNEKVNVMMFDTSIKQAGSMDSLCLNSGLNDFKRMIDWMERSEAKKLVLITDIYELHKELADFIESRNGRMRGDRDPLTAAEMLGLVDELAKSCK